MGMIMTDEQRMIFDEGVKFSFDLIKSYIEKHWDRECRLLEEKRSCIFSVWGFIESFSGNINFYKLVDDAVKERKISDDDRFFFEEGIADHNKYVLYCLQGDEIMNVVEHFKDYFSGKITALPNKNYPTYEDWANA